MIYNENINCSTVKINLCVRCKIKYGEIIMKSRSPSSSYTIDCWLKANIYDLTKTFFKKQKSYIYTNTTSPFYANGDRTYWLGKAIELCCRENIDYYNKILLLK